MAATNWYREGDKVRVVEGVTVRIVRIKGREVFLEINDHGTISQMELSAGGDLPGEETCQETEKRIG